MVYTGTKIIKTERLLLRPFKIDDYKDMFNNWANDKEVTKFLSWKPHQNPEESLKILEQWCSKYKNSNFFQWCIEYDNKAIGSIGVISSLEKDNLAEIGFCIGKNYWNQGITTEALCAIKNFLINKVQYKILIGAHHIENKSSGKVFIKSGFIRDKKMDKYEKYLSFDFDIVAYSFGKSI